MTKKFAAYKKSFNSNPDAFLEGVFSFCKQAAYGAEEEEKSLWDKIWPWLAGIGGGYALLSAGDMWGRYAQKHKIPNGPIRGIPSVILNHALPKDKRVDLSRGAATANGNGQ